MLPNMVVFDSIQTYSEFLTNVTVALCQEVCSADVTLGCRSVMYKRSTKQCYLNKPFIGTNTPGVVKMKNADYDYYERPSCQGKILN